MYNNIGNWENENVCVRFYSVQSNSTSPLSYHHQFVVFGYWLRPFFWHIQNKLTQLYVRMIEFMFIIFFPWWCWWNRFYDLDFLKVQILFSKLCNLSPALSCEWISLLSKCNLHCWRKVILLVNYSSTLLRTMKLVTILIINSFGFSQKSLPTCTYI